MAEVITFATKRELEASMGDTTEINIVFFRTNNFLLHYLMLLNVNVCYQDGFYKLHNFGRKFTQSNRRGDWPSSGFHILPYPLRLPDEIAHFPLQGQPSPKGDMAILSPGFTTGYNNRSKIKKGIRSRMWGGDVIPACLLKVHFGYRCEMKQFLSAIVCVTMKWIQVSPDRLCLSRTVSQIYVYLLNTASDRFTLLWCILHMN